MKKGNLARGLAVSSHSYGSLASDDPTQVEHFLLNVYQPVVASRLAAPSVRDHYNSLTGLPRLLNLVSAQLVHHVGVTLNSPKLFLPAEVLALPEDADSIRAMPLDVAFLARTEGEQEGGRVRDNSCLMGRSFNRTTKGSRRNFHTSA